MRKICFFLILAVLFACNEKYDFNIKNKEKGIVVEASISDKSFMQSLQIPSDGRYFSVSLTETNDVDNIRDVKISGAKVTLNDSEGNSYTYTEELLRPGMYYLKDDFFKAESELSYQLIIELNTGEKFESTWEAMPQTDNSIGEVFFEETAQDEYIFEPVSGQKVIQNFKGLNVGIEVPVNPDGSERFLLWDFEPFFTFSAGLLDVDHPNKFCWVSTEEYLKYTELQQDKKGGFRKDLFFIKTELNERIYDYFSVAIHQYNVTEDYYTFWKDLNGQRDKGGLYDQPPFGLYTNFTAVNNEYSCNGYFAVVEEAYTRWELDKSKLSFVVEDLTEFYCRLYFFDADPEGLDACLNCTVYPNGVSNNYPPDWWRSKYGTR